MAPITLVNAFAYVGGHDFTADSNALSFNAEVAENDATTFRDGGWKKFGPGGLKNGSLAMGGFWQSAASDAVDPILWNDLAVADRPMTFGPTETEGSLALMWQGAHYQYQLGGELGGLLPFSLEARNSNREGVVRGQLAKAMASVSATGVLGSVLNLGAVGATQYLYATLHVLGTPGTSVTVQLQSDDSAGFASPTTRATIGPLTSAGGTWMTRVAGAIADTHYRFNVSAITGTFVLAGAIGVQ
jgi:hypothetical protein